MQLTEHSLDGNLLNNAVRLRFAHCQVMPGGVAVAETPNNVVVLVATNQSVHRMLLPHPKRMYRSVSPLLVSRGRRDAPRSVASRPLRVYFHVFRTW